MREAHDHAAAFAARYAGLVGGLDGAGLVGVMRELAEIRSSAQRAVVYAQLRFATDSGDPERGALLDRMRSAGAEIEAALAFFELEWSALEDERAEALLQEAGAALDFAAHHLRVVRLKRAYLLSAAEERVMVQRRLTGELAWARLFETLAGAMMVDLDGETVPLAVAYNQLTDADGARRRTAMTALATAVQEGFGTRAYVFNTLLQDRAVEDRLRGYPSWLSARNLDHQLTDQAAQTLIEAVRGRYDIARRWCRVKASLLGHEQLDECDLMAPVALAESRYPYAAARELVLGAFGDLSPEVATLAARFFDERWIDAPIRQGKMAGAFCEDSVPELHPYVLLNYGGRRNDVATMAHELGHGLHALLASARGIFHQSPPTPVAETASTFGELLLLERMLEEAGSARERLGLLAAAADQSLLTVFHQVAYNQFEERVHTARRNEGELPADRVSELYREAWAELYGGVVEPHPGAERYWSVVPHFFLWPGYVYGYAYGQLLSLSLFARYREQGAPFVPKLLNFLAAGGSRSPQELATIVGVDLEDPGFWSAGLELVAAQVRAVEELAGEVSGESV